MKLSKIITITALNLVAVGHQNIYAQDNLAIHYHRNSLYSIVLTHSGEQQFRAQDIVDAFKKIPIPEKYNNHNLKHIVFPAPVLRKMSKDEFEGAYKDSICNLLRNNKIAGRLIEKWFNRDNKTGTFNMDLIKERGYYDAGVSDISLALHSIRGKAQLEDAGEKLIAHTYVLVNDIRYVSDTKEKTLQGILIYPKCLIPSWGANAMSKNINMCGFKVYVTSYLFRLDWTNEMLNDFYANMWMDNSNIIPERKQNFNKWMGGCKLNYLGYTIVYSGEMTDAGAINEKAVFVKVCTRSIDKAISNLQKSFDDFKVFTPLISTSPLKAYIGIKDGVEENSKYEVLEKVEDEIGRITYTRVGIIKPVKDKIWNNLYLSVEEGWEAAKLGFTTFEKVSGGDMLPGMLIREI